MRNMRLTSVAAALTLALGVTSATANEIGSVAAVNLQVDGTPPGSELRVLELSDPLYVNELITSSEVGNAQFLFKDQTSLTIAPKTELVLDSYVYDPDKQTGEMALSLTKGVLRFVGGRISKSTDVRVKTPSATIGIRGGLVIIEYIDGVLRVVHAAGEYTTVENVGSSLTVSRSSSLIEVLGGQAPEYMGPVPDSVVRRLYADLRGPGGGGARTTETIAAAFTRSGNEEAGEAAGTGSPAAAEAASAETPYLDPLSTAGEQPADEFSLALAEYGFSGDLEFHNLELRDFGASVVVGSPGIVDVGGEGFIRGQLVWTNNADLDLHLILPGNAGEVAFFNTVVEFNGGGATAALDADNLGGVINVQPDLRVENITVTGLDVPAGDYTFFVDNFSSNGNAQTDFDLTVTTDGGQTFVTQSDSLAPGEDSANFTVQSTGGEFAGGS